MNDVELLTNNLISHNEGTTKFSIYFNLDKFNHIRNGINEEIKDKYTYLLPDLNCIVEDKDVVKDLGI